MEINIAQITNKVSRSKRVVGALEATATRKFQNAKSEIILEVMKHPVSEALEDKTGNLGAIPNGTLYGFLGFEDDPITPAFLEEVKESFRIYPSTKVRLDGKEIKQDFYIDVPKPESVGDRLPWISIPWPVAIEEGISGLKRFIYWEPHANKGRSGQGLQSRNNLHDIEDSSKPIPYISEISKIFYTILKRKGFII